MNVYLRATQIWPVLAWAATNRQTLTYGILGKLIGFPARGMGTLLDRSTRTASSTACRR